ncbi:cation diffusion facilitator family transporter [Desulfotomaculum copahuensis]|uniref:Cation transporter n=1 Tax=Desulfotomaculum copahuensis TaxID=1838280 RepID=A0A1B7LHH3_9FIRM|nr:cation diffusion facilitator family transporter [Desulfotomaculum copahuensis]OAT85746.1 cation transporter [Desulfotomaculum copahuensis]
MDEKVKVARLSIASNTLLTAGKLTAGVAMNSVGVISEAIHSGLDLVAALIAYFSVLQSSRPADDRHLYGHGKFENVAAIVEALLIIGAGIMIIVEALPRLTDPHQVHALGWGALVMGVSAALNLVVSTVLMRTGRRTGSPALEADAWHLRTDVYTSAGVLTGIVIIHFTGLYILDPLIAIAVSLLIFKAAIDLLRGSLGSIVDVRLSDDEEAAIQRILSSYSSNFVQFHDLRTRRAGPDRYVDLHLVVPRCQSIAAVHELCDRIEADLQENMSGTSVLIHTEPCRPVGGDCLVCTVNIAVYRREEPSCHECDGHAHAAGQKSETDG